MTPVAVLEIKFEQSNPLSEFDRPAIEALLNGFDSNEVSIMPAIAGIHQPTVTGVGW